MVLVSSCKAGKTVVEDGGMIKKLSARKIVKKHLSAAFDKQTMETKLRVVYRSDKQKQTLSVKLRLDKDKAIWLNATYLGFMVARAKITPDKVRYYEKINKTYFEGDFSRLESLLGVAVSYEQLQNILTGQAMVNLKKQRLSSSIQQQAYQITPEETDAFFQLLFWVNPNHFKLDKQSLKHVAKAQSLEVSYADYKETDGTLFPRKMTLKALNQQSLTQIDIQYKSLYLDKAFTMSYKVPSGYKKAFD